MGTLARMSRSIPLWGSYLPPCGLSDESPPDSFRRKPPLCPTADSSNHDSKQLLPQCITLLCLLPLQKVPPPSAWSTPPLPWPPFPPLFTSISLRDSLRYHRPREVMSVPQGGSQSFSQWFLLVPCFHSCPNYPFENIFSWFFFFFDVLVMLGPHPIVIMTTLCILLHFKTGFSYLNISKIRLFWK